jgi:hypothetical protein
MRASSHLGCAIGVPCFTALDATCRQWHGRTAPPSIECGSVPGHRASTSGAIVTNASCQYPLCGPLAVLAVLDMPVGSVIGGRPTRSDGGPRRTSDAATACESLTRNGYFAAAYRALHIHRCSLAWRSALCDVVAMQASGSVMRLLHELGRRHCCMHCVCRNVVRHSLQQGAA